MPDDRIEFPRRPHDGLKRSSPRKRLGFGCVCLSLVIAASACSPAAIEVDPEARFQTIQGWSATAEIGDSDFPQARVAEYREEILDWAVDSMGINRLRLPVKSGYEHPEDLAPAFLADNDRRRQWVARWFYIENDNDDPDVADPDGFQLFFIDHLMETLILPVRDRLEARGERLYLNLNYVDFGSSPFEHRDDPEEFAEFMLVVVRHLDTKYGIVADAIEILEPDNDAEWTAQDVARGILAAGARLEQEGYRPDFIGPSNITVRGALEYMEEMMAVPGIDRYMAELVYHKYGPVEPEDIRAIAAMGERFGLRTAMLEHMYSGSAGLHEDLVLGNVSAWQKFGLMTYVVPDSVNGGLRYRDDAKLISEYFRNVRRGAVRIGATSSRRAFSPAAFVNPDGSTVVLVRASRGGSVTIAGVDPRSYDAWFVSDGDYATTPIQAEVGDDGTLGAGIPGSGLLVVRVDTGS